MLFGENGVRQHQERSSATPSNAATCLAVTERQWAEIPIAVATDRRAAPISLPI